MSDANLAPLAAFGFDSRASKVSLARRMAGGTLNVAVTHAAQRSPYAARIEAAGSSDMMSLGYSHALHMGGHSATLAVMALHGRQSQSASGTSVLAIANDSRFDAVMLTGQTRLAGIAFDARFLAGTQRFDTGAGQVLRLAPVRLTGWSIGASGQVARTGWQMSLSQPMRGTGTLVSFDEQRFDLGLTGNERRIEAGLSRIFGPWQLQANGVQRFNANHVRGAQDHAAWLRLSAGW
jgi:hypothetical protein